MKSEKFDVLFAVIAPREVTFFGKVADVLKERYNLTSAFLTFYQPGDSYLSRNGFHVFSLHKEVHLLGVKAEADRIARIENKYGVKNIRQLLLHEKLTFNRFDEDKLLLKLVEYDRYFDSLLRQHKIYNVVQELGGFIAPMSLYYNCIHHDVRHIFIEPSMFKGRLFFNVDSTNIQLNKMPPPGQEVLREVENYVGEYNKNKTVVVPDKDQHHFMDAGIRKFLNRRNIKRLCEKSYYKYIRREKEEYDAISNHIKQHLLMFLRRRLSKKFYHQPDYTKKYIYFPLHVPLDFQLTVREIRYLNQLSLIERIGDILPSGCQLYIKEHPASVGGYEYAALKRLLRNQNIKLIHPNVNSYDLIANASSIITINSKVGAEALMQGKAVIVLSNPYYAQARGAITLGDIQELPKVAFGYKNKTSEIDFGFLQRVYCNSFKGELYNEKTANVDDFACSLKTHLSKTDKEKYRSLKI